MSSDTKETCEKCSLKWVSKFLERLSKLSLLCLKNGEGDYT